MNINFNIQNVQNSWNGSPFTRHVTEQILATMPFRRQAAWRLWHIATPAKQLDRGLFGSALLRVGLLRDEGQGVRRIHVFKVRVGVVLHRIARRLRANNKRQGQRQHSFSIPNFDRRRWGVHSPHAYLALLLTDTYRSTVGPKRRRPQNCVLCAVSAHDFPKVPRVASVSCMSWNDAESPRAWQNETAWYSNYGSLVDVVGCTQLPSAWQPSAKNHCQAAWQNHIRWPSPVHIGTSTRVHGSTTTWEAHSEWHAFYPTCDRAASQTPSSLTSTTHRNPCQAAWQRFIRICTTSVADESCHPTAYCNLPSRHACTCSRQHAAQDPCTQ